MRSIGMLALFALACGSPPAGGDAGAPDAGGPFVEPTPPAPPVFAPCPTGWSIARAEDAFDVCEPPSGAACPAGLERFTDSAECVPVGRACPSGEWAEPPADASRVLYVRAGASGGDGSEASPYGSIQLAITGAPAGGVVLVGKGTYDEPIDVYGGVRVIGACAAETILAPTTATPTGYVVLASELDAGLESVTVRPTAMLTGILVRGELALDGVVIEDVVDEGISVEGGTLTARALVIRDVSEVTPLFGYGVAVGDGTVTIERAIFERCGGATLIVSSGSTLTARAVVARSSGRSIAGAPQIVAQGGGVLELSDSLIEDAIGSGIYANVGGIARVDQVVVRRMRHEAATNTPAAGVMARDGSRIEARRLRIDDVDVLGAAFADTSTAQLEDSYIAGVARTTMYEAGEALSTRSDLVARRVWIARAETVALLSMGPAIFDVEDLTISDIGNEEFFSEGIVLTNVTGSMRRTHVFGSQGAALVGFGEGLALTLEDMRTSDILPGHEAMRGRGIELRDGTATLSRILIERSREVGLLAYFGAAVTATDVRVIDTLERACATTTCADEPAGTAIATVDAALAIRGFEVRGARLCGAQVAGSGDLDLRDGEIEDTLVGACVQRTDYDVARLTDGVLFQENGVNVQSTMHSVPPPSNPLPTYEI